ncbi:MAG: hypothetical protein ABIT58_09465, partial [Ferruginibacter sp.]
MTIEALSALSISGKTQEQLIILAHNIKLQLFIEDFFYTFAGLIPDCGLRIPDSAYLAAMQQYLDLLKHILETG